MGRGNELEIACSPPKLFKYLKKACVYFYLFILHFSHKVAKEAYNVLFCSSTLSSQHPPWGNFGWVRVSGLRLSNELLWQGAGSKLGLPNPSQTVRTMTTQCSPCDWGKRCPAHVHFCISRGLSDFQIHIQKSGSAIPTLIYLNYTQKSFGKGFSNRLLFWYIDIKSVFQVAQGSLHISPILHVIDTITLWSD